MFGRLIIILTIIVFLALQGCVTPSTLIVTSQPSGAEVHVKNPSLERDFKLGTTPLEFEFKSKIIPFPFVWVKWDDGSISKVPNGGGKYIPIV